MKIYALFVEEKGDLTCLAASYSKAKVAEAMAIIPEGARAFYLNPAGLRKVKTKTLKVNWNPQEVAAPEPVAEVAAPVAVEIEDATAAELMGETKRRGRPPKQ